MGLRVSGFIAGHAHEANRNNTMQLAFVICHVKQTKPVMVCNILFCLIIFSNEV